MARFYISKLSIFGENKPPSYIEFKNGLNIVHGVSDTGKSCIIKCIDFVFGSKNKEPIPPTHGYTIIKLQLETDKGQVTLERIIGKNKVKIVSLNDDIVSGEFKLDQLGVAILPLIGITGSPQIIKNGNYDRVNLTWRTFLRSFLIHEEEVIQSQPILISKESTAKTASLSGLLYLIAKKDFSQIDSIEDKKIREARKRAVEAYIHKQISLLSEKQKLIDETPDTDGIHERIKVAEREIEKLIDELSLIESRINEKVETSRNVYSKILAERDRLAECDLLLSRYEELRSQYTADIKRLSFIVDGETSMADVTPPEKCPFCDGSMPECKHPTFIESANAELARITKLLIDLAETEKTVIVDRDNAKHNLELLVVERNSCESLIRNELKPKAQSLKDSLSHYRRIIRVEKERELLDRFRSEKIRELDEMMLANDEVAELYRPIEHFPVEFENTMTKMYYDRLLKCKYENLDIARFLIRDFDVTVNAKAKANYGKGFRAFLNVVLAIVMREYLCEHGEFSPRLLIIDSPLLSLKQSADERTPESMKSALVEYLMKTQSIGQTIIIENTIPELEYEKYNVTLHEFTKGKSAGRWGLLADVCH